MPNYQADSPEVVEFLSAWHENGRAAFEREYSNLVYDTYYPKHVGRVGRRFLALDKGTSGMFLLERETGDLYSIKAYGTPNRRVGTLAGLTRAYRDATTAARTFANPGYVGADRALQEAGR